MTDFLLELRSEEIPARMQDKARADLARLFAAEITKAGLSVDTVDTYATPRRLVLIARGLPTETAAVSEEIKGPKTSAPPQALDGFLRKTGLTTDQLVDRDGTYFAVIEKAGRATREVLCDAIPFIIKSFPWPKSMRWGVDSAATESLRWVRPLQGIVALLGREHLNFAVAGVSTMSTTKGHRFHHSGDIAVNSVADYAAQLRAAHVILDQDERAAIIREGAAKCARDAGLVLVEDEGLVAENAGLTEWPVPMLGRFDPAFLSVPQEVIQLTARVNQKYFICRTQAGDLANAFVCAANLEPSDGGAAVVAGNEKVLAARLSDAKFFWEADLKVRLEDQAAKLSNIVFHEKLGTVADKVERVAKLARWLVESGVIKSSPERGGEPAKLVEGHSEGVAPSDVQEKLRVPLHHPADGSPPRSGEELADQAETAARLCKADLVTGMVGEFPELQGIMGGYYARAQGHCDAVADAIRDHYKPVGQGDDVPTAPVTVAVSLADKLDTLFGFFIVGEQPTGSRDPFALRRAALSMISTLLSQNIRLQLLPTIFEAYWGLRKTIINLQHKKAFVEFLTGSRNLPHAPRVEMLQHILGSRGAQMAGASDEELEPVFRQVYSLTTFFADRLKVQQREAGVRHDLIDAVFALGGEDDLVRLLARVKALQAFVGTDAGANLLAGYKRAGNILKQAAVDKNDRHPELVSGSIPQQGKAELAESWMLKQVQHDGVGVEADLLTALNAAEPLAAAAIAAEDFEAAMSALSTLRAPIDAFFEGVMVNDPDPAVRTFRLGLLARFRDAVHTVADFSKIEG